MKTGSAKEKQDNHGQTRPMSNMADTAMKSYEQAIRTSFKLQEEAGRWWTSMFHQANLAQDWQRRLSTMTGMANNMMPLAQRRMEEVMDLMEKNSRTSAELLKKAVDAAQTPALAESQAKWMEFWTSSMGAVRSNTEAVSQISSKAIDSWIDFVRKNSEVTEVRAPKSL